MKTFRYKIVKTKTDMGETELNEFGYTYYFKIETTNG